MRLLSDQEFNRRKNLYMYSTGSFETPKHGKDCIYLWENSKYYALCRPFTKKKIGEFEFIIDYPNVSNGPFYDECFPEFRIHINWKKHVYLQDITFYFDDKGDISMTSSAYVLPLDVLNVLADLFIGSLIFLFEQPMERVR